MLIILFIFKFIPWTVSLGSGTSGGTFAPLFKIGCGLGAFFGLIILTLFPNCKHDIRIAAIIERATMLAGSGLTLLFSIIFAFVTIRQPYGILPLLTAFSATYLVSSIMMKNTIMIENIVRRGVNVPVEYEADFLDQMSVKEYETEKVYSISAEDKISKALEWLTSGEPGSLHHGYAVIHKNKRLS